MVIIEGMQVNKLLVNQKKTMFILYGRRANYCLYCRRIEEIELENGLIKPASIGKYLGVMVDKCLTFKDPIAFISTKLAKEGIIPWKLKNCSPKWSLE